MAVPVTVSDQLFLVAFRVTLHYCSRWVEATMRLAYYQPLFAGIVLMLVAYSVYCWRVAKSRKSALMVALAMAVFLVSWPPFANMIVARFERPYPPQRPSAVDAEAIVVLASSVYPVYPPLPTPRLGSDTYERCQYAAWLHKNWRPLPVLASGGIPEPTPDTPPYANSMGEALRREGVPKEMIWSEVQSGSTYENALYSARLLRQRGIHKIVLVTDAYHMARAERCFRKQGLQVVPASCGHREFHMYKPDRLLPNWEAIAWNEDSLHEAVGLIWYRLRGWI
jgi:uncharacterized SAM-binding protein YcdF (DUF218 family)